MVEWVKQQGSQGPRYLDELEIASAVTAMRDTWNYLANENAMHHIASREQNWTENNFFDSGERDTAKYLDPVLARLGFNPQDKKLLEIGCGVGRMSFSLARRFGEVDSLDISPEMIKRAIEYKEKFGVRNVHFHLGCGKDLAGFGEEQFDFCFSYIVFQHIPSVDLIFDYVREIGRVLKPAGGFLVQVNGYPHIRLTKSLYLVAGVRDTGRLRKYGIGKRPFVRLGRLDLMNGIPIRPSAMLDVCRSAGLTTKEIIGAHSQYMWFAGQKTHGKAPGSKMCQTERLCRSQ
jgi:ubiquinone/menaquinone biosynthesis C-methylase UbiE